MSFAVRTTHSPGFPGSLLRALFLVTALGTAAYAQQMTCSASAFPVSVRGQGYAERLADIQVVCQNGTPTAEGVTVPAADITVTLNATVTSRQFANTWSEAILMV